MDVNNIEELPDYPLLRQIQSALWKTGQVYGAAVIVGAGFSRFADRTKDTTPAAPLWKDFREAMHRELYPKNEDHPPDPLVLAEEYKASLGINALESLVKNLVRDEERTPGELHKNLLRLPWSNVLTTNWDTLLERTIDSNPNSPFGIVRTPEDLSDIRPPRIIKLHGSLPDLCPFIFTYEDFRTYEARFELFVTLTKQVLIDNEICLLGVSGEDPNFLAWSGWVRDQLGTKARPIRLIGILDDISPSRRHLFEKLNVTPIDLAPLVSNPEQDRHRHAMEIFLEFLRKAKPQIKTEWKLTSKEKLTKNTSCPNTQLANLAKAWAQDRENYPGWLAAPPPIRKTLRDDFISYEQLLHNLDKASKSVKASILYESVWRCETAFWPLPDFIENTISEMITADDDNPLPLRQRCLLRTSIVRAARRRRDWSAFDKRIKLLNELDSTTEVEALYEYCLRARDELDYGFIKTHVENITGQDSVWLLRRAALTAEIGDTYTAAKLIYEAHREIQRQRAHDRHSLWLLSREAWTSLLMRNARFLLEGQLFEDQPTWPIDYKNAKTDPWEELRFYDGEIDEFYRRYRNATTDEHPQFDTGVYRVHIEFLNSTATYASDYLPILAEHVGIPIKLGPIDILRSRLGRAVQVQDDHTPINIWTSIRVLAANNDSKLIENRFSRVAVAHLPFEIVSDIAKKLRDAITFEKNGLATIQDNYSLGEKLDDVDRINRVSVMIELLSRFSMRFQGDESLELFRFGVSLMCDPNIKNFRLFDSLNNLLRRSLKALEPERHCEVALEVLKLPLPSEKGISSSEDRWPEVSDCLSPGAYQVLAQNRESSSRIQFLIKAAGDSSSTLSRQHATFRLWGLFEDKALNKNEVGAFGTAIWQHSQSGEFPSDLNLPQHAFLELPSPNSHTTRLIFDTSIVKKLVQGSFSEDRLQAIFKASHPNREEHKLYKLNSEDAICILDHALNWQKQPDRRFPSIFLGRNTDESVLFGSLIGNSLASTVLPSIKPGSIRDDQIRKFLECASDGSRPEFVAALPALIRLDEKVTEEATTAIRKGLSSQHRYVVRAAMRAMFWFEKLAREKIIPIPEVLVREIISICLMRHEPGLISALNCVRLLVKAGIVPKPERDLLINLLALLREETEYENWLDESRRPDVGLIRKQSVMLAEALKDAGINEPILDKWLEDAISDPMPEVRYALSDRKNA